MSHDKIKAAARSRMARTGESYAAARRQVIKRYKARRRGASTFGTNSFAAMLPDTSKLAAAMARSAVPDTSGVLGRRID